MKTSVIVTFTLVILMGGCCCIPQPPVCSKPYTQIGSDCCLDGNGDNICDKDETTTIASTITTTTRATTIKATTVITTTKITIRTTTTTQPTSIVFLDSGRKIEIVGSKEFISETKKALNLLKKSSYFQNITAHLERIREYEHSGMDVHEDVPTYQVNVRTWNYSTMWYAGTIAHDSYHSTLYFNAREANGGAEPDTLAWTGKVAEQKCTAFQILVLQQLGADEYTINYLKELEKNPTWQDVPYENRTW